LSLSDSIGSSFSFIHPCNHSWQRLSHPCDVNTLLSRYVQTPEMTYSLQDILPDDEKKNEWEKAFAEALDALLIKLEYAPCAFMVVERHPSAFSNTTASSTHISYDVVICNVQDGISNRFWPFLTISGLTEEEKNKVSNILDLQFQLSEP